MLINRHRNRHQAAQEADVPDEDVPTEKWKNADIEAYAATHGIDLTGASTKADYLERIEAAGNSDGTTPDE